MKKRIKKKLIRDGVCPVCKSVCGYAAFDDQFKIALNNCTDCFHVSAIDGKNIIIEHSPQLRETWKQAQNEPPSEEIQKFMKEIGIED